MISHGKGAKQTYSSIKLSHLGCYNIVLNADSGKENVRLGLEYFSTPKQEIQTVETQTEANLIFYTTPQCNTRIDLAYDGETFWITQKKISELFDVGVNTISYHLSQIFESEELNKHSVVRKIRITASDGKDYLTSVYNLDAIIAVGYRVNSYKVMQFGIFATKEGIDIEFIVHIHLLIDPEILLR